MINDSNSLGRRLRQYEIASRQYLIQRVPVILSLSCTSYENCIASDTDPISELYLESMWRTALSIVENIPSCSFGYVGISEMSFLLTDYKHDGAAWLNNNVSKIISLSSAIASVKFSQCFTKPEVFTAAAWNLPKDEVANYFIWKQHYTDKEAMLAYYNFYKKNNRDISKLTHSQVKHRLLEDLDHDWESDPFPFKNGAAIIKEYDKSFIEENVPSFSGDRAFVDKFVGDDSV